MWDLRTECTTHRHTWHDVRDKREHITRRRWSACFGDKVLPFDQVSWEIRSRGLRLCLHYSQQPFEEEHDRELCTSSVHQFVCHWNWSIGTLFTPSIRWDPLQIWSFDVIRCSSGGKRILFSYVKRNSRRKVSFLLILFSLLIGWRTVMILNPVSSSLRDIQSVYTERSLTCVHVVLQWKIDERKLDERGFFRKWIIMRNAGSRLAAVSS